ncbi:Crp/Fnr family transcriptional regulator [Dysgonomonas macrotermitis]|uniref:cAMP-binding domain of CRP or a regulatory subunit of cAMP-dependent protein kinases n=1 Tax=Dysgonomonas macrotermitis TaxID=1346286 RepID=A0A1M5AZ93_9BACT|nr:Crp/Fnr family transcriptional regulator [Dysgonomonas macrotermitis]SHF35558.1 cAMP-binding domain of CRP or a regulatory subunit of cAMP-dependent protein kinases [Dysgonomonas macrotermitis]
MNTFVEHIINNIPSFSAEEILSVMDTGTPLLLKKNEVFLDYGKYAHHLAIVQTGLLEMVISMDGMEKIVEFLPPYSLAAEFASFSLNKPAECQIRATQDSDILVFKKVDLNNLFETNPKLNVLEKYFMEIFYSSAMDRIRWMYLPPKERYETFRQKYSNIIQLVPQYKIASYLNVSPEWLSKTRLSK